MRTILTTFLGIGLLGTLHAGEPAGRSAGSRDIGGQSVPSDVRLWDVTAGKGNSAAEGTPRRGSCGMLFAGRQDPGLSGQRRRPDPLLGPFLRSRARSG